MEIVSYNNCAELGAVEDVWERLGEQGLFFVPSFSELRHQLETSGYKFRLVVAVDNSKITAIACFIYENGKKDYRVGKRKLLHLPVRVVSLFGSCVLGQPSESVIREFFHHVIKEGDFDLINVGHIFVDSPVYNAVTNLHGAISWRVARKEKHWWLIRLPGSFYEYLASLREKTKVHLIRDCHKFERKDPDFRVMQLPEDIDIFLRDAETISRLTYQWNLTFGICNDESTRQHLGRLAKNGTLRCYITYLQGRPCAFGWGELSHRKFYFRQTGFDPQYRKLSPGTALIMRMIQDLIENTDCDVFDLQWGGKDGYKSRFGTVSLRTAAIQVAQIYKPYALLICALDQTLNLAKNSVGLVVERGPLKTRLRSVLRRYGVGTF